MPSTQTGDLEGRTKVRLRLRQNLQITLQTRSGRPGSQTEFGNQGDAKTCFVVKDPVTLRYFHLDEAQRFIVGLMDGAHTLEEIRQAYEKKHRPHRMSLEELEGFSRELLESGLVLNDAPAAGRLAVERSKKHSRKWWHSLLNIFCIKIPLTNPDRWLTRCQVLGQSCFSTWFVALSLGLFLGGLGLLATHWHEFLARLPSYQDFFSLQTLFYLWLTLGLVKILHELGHAFCCKRMGADVQEIGVMILFFFPTLYCNVSDSWALKSKWNRIAVSAAGIYVELIIASLATFLWWFSDSNTFWHNLSFALMVVCSVNTLLCNANPLMRFDGYYVLADWMEMPNLAQQASQSMQMMALRWLGVEIRPVESTRPGFLLVFGLASLGYRWYVMALAMYFLFEFLKQHHLAALGSILLAVGLVTLIGAPVYRLLRRLHQKRRIPEMKPIRVWLSAAFVLGLVAGFFLIPLPRKIRGVALVQVTPDQVQRVVIPEAEGFLQEVLVRDGQRVRAGDVLAVLSNPKLEIKLRLNEADQALRYQQQNALIAQLTEVGNPKEDSSADWQQSEQELKSLVRQRRTLKEQRDRLILRAPAAGVIMGLPSPEEKGKWFEKGTELCRIGNDEALRTLVLVDPADHGEVRPSSQAWIRIHGLLDKQCTGMVTGISQVEAKNVPAALSSKVAGDVPTQHDPVTNTDKPLGQHYVVTVQLRTVDATIHPGVLGRVKIEAESRTLWWRLRRYLGTTLNWGL
jgi:putative peptide zinc metalloprotease protein